MVKMSEARSPHRQKSKDAHAFTKGGISKPNHVKQQQLSANGSDSRGTSERNGKSKISSVLAGIVNVLPRRIKFKTQQYKDVDHENQMKKYKPINGQYHSQANGMSRPTSTQAQAGRDKKEDPNKFKGPTTWLCNPDKISALMAWKTSFKIGCGLHNLGNTCFLNSVLQCLTYTPSLYNLMKKKEHTQNCHIKDFCMFCELEKHIVTATAGHGRAMAPKNIVRNLRSIAKHLKFGRQEDAHEFVRYVVDGLQKSALRQNGLPPKASTPTSRTTSIHQIFGGHLLSQVKCGKCGYESNTFDPFLDLSVGVTNSKSLKHSLQTFTSIDRLDGDNKYKCERCAKLVPATKQFTIFDAPNILTIQLKRFEFAMFGGGKITRPIAFPPTLDLSPYISKQPRGVGPYVYDLYGVLVHHGHSCNSGHYYSFVKNSNGVWYCMDDSDVRQVSEGTVMQQKAYILFYARRPGRTTACNGSEKELKHSASSKPSPSKPSPVLSSKPIREEDFLASTEKVKNRSSRRELEEKLNGEPVPDEVVLKPKKAKEKVVFPWPSRLQFRLKSLRNKLKRSSRARDIDPSEREKPSPAQEPTPAHAHAHAHAHAPAPAVRSPTLRPRPVSSPAKLAPMESASSMEGNEMARNARGSYKVSTRELGASSVDRWEDAGTQDVAAQRAITKTLHAPRKRRSEIAAQKWDEEYDAGRVKKVKKSYPKQSSGRNSFQQLSNEKNHWRSLRKQGKRL